MSRPLRTLLLAALAGLLLHPHSAGAQASPRPTLPSEWPVLTPRDLLDYHHEPTSPTDRSHEIFFDAGAWHGYALPAASDRGTGFIGPFLSATGPGLWAAQRFGTVAVLDARSGTALPLLACDGGGYALPGALVRRACGEGFAVEETLFYASASTTLLRVTVTVSRVRALRLRLEAPAAAAASPGELTTRLVGLSAPPPPGPEGAYTLTLPGTLRPGRPATVYLQQIYLPTGPGTALPPWHGRPRQAWARAGARWQGYLAAGRRLRAGLAPEPDLGRLSAKAIVTLLANWRAPLGDLHYAGLFPSYSNPDFSAFWAWDSWKHAAALALFAPALAKDQVRTMFSFQQPDGMIPDNVFRDHSQNNLRNTKPPLAAWAVASIYRATHDRQFVLEIFPSLVRYHRWWYSHRDHDGNGLAEYGSTDGTLAAARWESGMDNAVRFDATAMLQNSAAAAWSMNQESVDLNSYLYQDKQELAGLAEVLGRTALAAQLHREAAALRQQVQQVFFNPQLGYFFDVQLGSHRQITDFGPEGWIPLWTGVASPAQAKAVARALSDPQKFNTPFPFPTLARDNPRFSPVAQPTATAGYWRGPVWIDQAVFAVQGLERYGLTAQAAAMREKLLHNSPGLASGTEPFRETYDPDTGAGGNSRNFSWSAAEYYLLLH